MTCYDDIRTLTHGLPNSSGQRRSIAVDVISGGFPCQDISFAGKGAGIDGERSGLWGEYARLIGEIRPRYTIVENVSALLVRGIERVLGDLAALGYDAEWHCIPAATLAPLTEGTGYGSSPTHSYPDATTQDHIERRCTSTEMLNYETNKSVSLDRFVRQLPTPTCRDWKDGSAEACQNVPVNSLLGRAVHQWPTPRAADGAKGTRTAERHSEGNGAQQRAGSAGGGWWRVEPDVGRVAHGVPNRVDRLRGLGNAVVPQIPELIGRAILAARAAA